MNISWLILTCSLHYLAMIPIKLQFLKINLPFFNQMYINTIFLSTTFGILAHYLETNYLIWKIDYIIAGLWFLEDVLWSFELENYMVIFLNIFVFGLNTLATYTNNYIMYHSIWHVISAIKCIYISFLIQKSKNYIF